MEILRATGEHLEVWKNFRLQLFGEVGDEINDFDIARLLDSSNEDQALLAFIDGKAAGFAEMALRNLVDGCSTSPVGYLEAIFVSPEFRGRGIAAALLKAAENWAISAGCCEFATDSELHEGDAQNFHRHMGFEETFRIVQFRKSLSKSDCDTISR